MVRRGTTNSNNIDQESIAKMWDVMEELQSANESLQDNVFHLHKQWCKNNPPKGTEILDP